MANDKAYIKCKYQFVALLLGNWSKAIRYVITLDITLPKVEILTSKKPIPENGSS